MHPDTIERLLTVRGAGFTSATTATWVEDTQTSLAVQFVDTNLIRVVIPGTIGTNSEAAGVLVVTTGNISSTVSLKFGDTLVASLCDVQPVQFTTQTNSITFTLYGDGLFPSGTSFSANGSTVPIVGQASATVATATVSGTWPQGNMTVMLNSSSGNVLGESLFTLTINPPVTISAPALRLYAGQTVSETVTVTGGTLGPNGFQWPPLTNGPPWVTIQSTGPRTATFTATPPTTTVSPPMSPTFQVQIQVMESVPDVPVTSAVTAQVTVDAIPDMAIMVQPALVGNKLQPDQDYTLLLGTNRATPIDLMGQINLGSSTATLVSGMDPASSLRFEIKPNCVLSDNCGARFTLKAGTVAGSVPITGTVAPVAPEGAGVPPPVAFPAATFQQDPAVPQIDANRVSVSLTRGSFTICVPGFTNTREMKTAVFRFEPVTGKTLSPLVLIRPVDSDFAAWFTPQNEGAQGGFGLPQRFNVDGNIGDIGQVYVTLVNSVGPSGEVGTVIANAPLCTVH
jgi:hypothetical protein